MEKQTLNAEQEDFLLEQAREQHYEKEEFDLSKKITFVTKEEDWILLPSDVKEFIRLLKGEIDTSGYDCDEDLYEMINKLAGDKLR